MPITPSKRREKLNPLVRPPRLREDDGRVIYNSHIAAREGCHRAAAAMRGQGRIGMDEALPGTVADTDEAFWAALERLVRESEVVIDRPRGSVHPRYPNMIYGMDYGYLTDTASMDGGGIDVWRGAGGGNRISGAIVTVDLVKRDSEIKILLGCSEEEISGIIRFHNDSEYMKALLIRRR